MHSAYFYFTTVHEDSYMQKNLVCCICVSCRRVFIFDDDIEDHSRQTGHQQFDNQEFELAFNHKAATELKLILHQSIIASLHSLGERPMNAILYHLSAKGVSIDSTNLDVKSFYSSLEEILGYMADTIVDDIIQQLCIHYRIDKSYIPIEIPSQLHPIEALYHVIKIVLNS